MTKMPGQMWVTEPDELRLSLDRKCAGIFIVLKHARNSDLVLQLKATNEFHGGSQEAHLLLRRELFDCGG